MKILNHSKEYQVVLFSACRGIRTPVTNYRRNLWISKWQAQVRPMAAYKLKSQWIDVDSRHLFSAYRKCSHHVNSRTGSDDERALRWIEYERPRTKLCHGNSIVQIAHIGKLICFDALGRDSAINQYPYRGKSAAAL